MQARQVARELALLSIGQIAHDSRLDAQQLQDIVVAAVRTLTSVAQDTLENAAADLQQSNAKILNSQTRAADVTTAREMLSHAIELTQGAINRLSLAVEIPEMVQLANQKDVRAYAIELISTTRSHQAEIDQTVSAALVDWQLSRLAHIDRDILRLAVTEIQYLGVDPAIAINQAVELAKRYSGDDGHRFINGVLRRVTDQMKKARAQG